MRVRLDGQPAPPQAEAPAPVPRGDSERRLLQVLAGLDAVLPDGTASRQAVFNALASGRRVRPGFADAWIAAEAPASAETVKEYRTSSASVRLLFPRDGADCVYWLSPDEFSLRAAELQLLRDAMAHVRAGGARDVRRATLVHPRRFVEEAAADFLRGRLPACGVAEERTTRAARLARVVGRYTVGLGVLEHVLEDPHVTDIYSDAPCGVAPLYLSTNMADARVGDRLATNITLEPSALSALVTRARMESGRPFSEARPHLEHDLEEFGARLTVIGPPVCPEGVALAIRRHSKNPLTLVQLVAGGALAPMTAGLLSVLVEGQCSLLIGGARGAGKTTLLGALMLEMDAAKRIVTIEDTMELPVAAMRQAGFRVQALRVRSALGGEGEATADEALKLSLRLGESALVVGEVRGAEARTLYEAMRTGAASSAVMGTIHGSPASAVCARAIHDLGVPPAAFAATDAVIIAGLVRPDGARRQVRRVTEVAEVEQRRDTVTTRDLLREVGPERAPTAESLAVSRLVSKVAAAWGVPTGTVVEEVKARAELKLRQLALARALDRPELLAAGASVAVNARYARLRDDGLRGPPLVQAVVDEIRRRWA
ncbi:MAG TPA: type II/IV secretion system ATPase subunit [Candidatus Thermoplasmatota archaeon]